MKKSAIPRADPVFFEHIKLEGQYSVMEIAKLAAACAETSAEERIEEAVTILAAVESASRNDKWENERLRRLRVGDTKGASRERIKRDKEASKLREECKEIGESCCREAERDRKTGKIIRRSLVSLICQKAGVTEREDSKHSMRLFNEFIESTGPKFVESFYPEIAKNTPEWKNASKWLSDAYRNRIETGKRTLLMQSETEASMVAAVFLHFLKTRPKQERPKSLISHAEGSKGKFVSPKTRGASRAHENAKGTGKRGQSRKPGQFLPKS